MSDFIHILRNPWGHSEEEIRKARLEACDEVEMLRTALKELVRLKDIKDRIDLKMADLTAIAEYNLKKPLAWAAARRALRIDP